jgi:3',5'-cyclic AMP phosphodiesterase CpdA
VNRSSGLRFQDGRFKIAQFTDAHFCDGSDEDARTRALVERVLDAERPDLVVLTGDFVDGSRSPDPAATWVSAVEPFEVRGLPWAAVFGNHDDEGSRGREELFEVQRACAHCLSERGPRELTGVGNYVIDVAADAGRGLRLYFLDSGSYDATGAGDYAWIAHDQISWFRERSGESDAPALVFFHIPLPEYETAWDEGERIGSRNEDVYCPRINSGFFAALHESRRVRGTFCGHDHVNDFEARLHGIRLCYGRATGYNTYGQDGFARGARMIEVSAKHGGFDTWLRLDGDSLPTLRQTGATGPVLAYEG